MSARIPPGIHPLPPALRLLAQIEGWIDRIGELVELHRVVTIAPPILGDIRTQVGHHIAPNGVAFLSQLAQHPAEIDGVLENERVGDQIAIVQPLFLLNGIIGIDDP